MIWKQQKCKKAKHISVRAKRTVGHTSLQHFWQHLSSPLTSRDTISRYSDCWARPQLYWEPILTSWNNQSKQNTKRNLCKAEAHTIIPIVQVTDELRRSGNIYLPLEQVGIKLQLSFQHTLHLWKQLQSPLSFQGKLRVIDSKPKNFPYHFGVANYSETQRLVHYESEHFFLSYLPSAESNTDLRLESVM